MRTNDASRGIKPAIVAVVLALFAVTGLSAGITVGAALGRAGKQPSGDTRTITAASAAASPSPSVTSYPTIAPYAASFTLAAVVAPNPAATGEHLTIKVKASGADGASPAPGIRCTIEDITGTTLLPPTVAPVVTDASGRASWDFVVPEGAVGPHTLKVAGVGAKHYSYYIITTVTIAG